MKKKKGKKEAEPGDRVRVFLAKEEYEGTLLETSNSEKGLVLLKLDSGYNLGFDKKKIFNIKLVKKAEKAEEELEIKKNSKKPDIAMIITGGTIAARLNPRKGGVDWLSSPEDLFRFYPELFDRVNIAKLEIPFMKASEDMDFRDWQRLARITGKLLNDKNIKGILITHGTDFLHYTSAALSFMLGGNNGLNKPVVLTYSQRSIDRASSDANLNLECSALVSISDIAEVVLVGHASTNDDFCYVMPGTKVRKLHTSRRDAFKVINDKPIARVSKDRIEKISEHNFRNKNRVKADTKFEEKVALIKIYPGQSPEILDFYVRKKYKGIVLEMSGLGHAPTKRARNSWIQKLRDIQRKGLIVCATSQCIFGRTDPLVYSNGRELLDTGIIYLGDMLSETAIVKLGWVLGHKEWAKNKEKIREKMMENISHELNERLEE